MDSRPWALEMARLCMDMSSGVFIRMPLGGDVLDQIDWVTNAVRMSWRLWYIIEVRPGSMTGADMDFLSYALPDIFPSDKPLEAVGG